MKVIWQIPDVEVAHGVTMTRVALRVSPLARQESRLSGPKRSRHRAVRVGLAGATV